MKTNEDNKFSMIVPEMISIENVSSLYAKIKKLETIPSPPHIEFDFKDAREFDSSAIAFFNYVKRTFPGVSFKNVSDSFEKLFEMFPLTAEPSSKPAITFDPIPYSKKAVAIAEKFLFILRKLLSFFMLLADEIYYTVQYLTKRRGVYPGEISNQLFLMGYKSYPIVSVISFLVGITISITSIEQLQRFGADIYIADMIGFGMIRELVPMMTGIILAGKIGASITAEIASMKIMEETDALKTMGIVPEKFLMVPRLIAITLVIPLLVAMADFVGIFAGVLIARILSDIPFNMFMKEMFTIVELGDFFIGLMKTLVFGWLIVISSGFKGFSVKQGAAEVGIATTESVVLSISLIIIFDCIFAFILY